MKVLALNPSGNKAGERCVDGNARYECLPVSLSARPPAARTMMLWGEEDVQAESVGRQRVRH